jgi:hypothetical protein
MNRKPIAIFYHLWAPPTGDLWRLILDEQVKRMKRASLPNNADLYCCIAGQQKNAIAEFISDIDWLTVVTSTEDETAYEGLTLTALARACHERPDLSAVAYVHMKGISHFNATTPPGRFRAINSWRHLLEWGVIDRWRDAVGRLQASDLVGANFRPDPFPHFSGNMWWARADYVRRLPPPVPGRLPVAANFDAVTASRVGYELWVGQASPRVFSFCDFPTRAAARHWTARSGEGILAR